MKLVSVAPTAAEVGGDMFSVCSGAPASKSPERGSKSRIGAITHELYGCRHVRSVFPRVCPPPNACSCGLRPR